MFKTNPKLGFDLDTNWDIVLILWWILGSFGYFMGDDFLANFSNLKASFLESNPEI